MMETPVVPIQKPASPAPAQDRAALRDAQFREKAHEFEAVFIGQMLKHSGLTTAVSGDSGFGGEAFSNMLTDQYAEELLKNGGFGLAEEIYQQLVEKEQSHGSGDAY